MSYREAGHQRCIGASEMRALGTCTVVLNIEKQGELLVARQRLGKRETGRKVGELDIFTETAVIEPDGTVESAENNRIASLSELLNNTGIEAVGKNLHLVCNDDNFSESFTTSGVFFRTTIVAYDGPGSYSFMPTAADEVEPAFSLPISAFLDQSELVRPLAKEVVQSVVKTGKLDEAYRSYDAGKGRLIFPEGIFDIETFQQQRDRKPDCIIYIENKKI